MRVHSTMALQRRELGVAPELGELDLEQWASEIRVRSADGHQDPIE